MTKTNFIRCAKCEEGGIRKVLGELTESGYVVVQRRHNTPPYSNEDTTVVGGRDFFLVCGGCGAVVFTRKTENVQLTGTVRYFGTP